MHRDRKGEEKAHDICQQNSERQIAGRQVTDSAGLRAEVKGCRGKSYKKHAN